MKKVVTIGGGNGHSNLLKGIRKTFYEDIELTTIVAMSDDGRTTGKLMKIFEKEKGKYFPPPGDLRKCLYSLSQSKHAHIFELLMETSFKIDTPIKNFSIEDYFNTIIKQIIEKQPSILGEDIYEVQKFLQKRGDFYENFSKKLAELSQNKLQIEATIEGHKLGNILMANLCEKLGSFQLMMDTMHQLLKVRANILPVTTDKAIIKAKLDTGEVIETQDAISNIANYSGKIVSLELCSDSTSARYFEPIKKPLEEADFIIIAPGDLYTSTIANFIIGGVKSLLKKSKAKIIFVANNTNKGGETFGYSLQDFVDEIQKYLERDIDILIVNSKHIELSFGELEKLKSNVSVQGGDYIYLTKKERDIFRKQGIKIIEDDLIDRDTLYKHDRKQLGKVLERIIL